MDYSLSISIMLFHVKVSQGRMKFVKMPHNFREQENSTLKAHNSFPNNFLLKEAETKSTKWTMWILQLTSGSIWPPARPKTKIFSLMIWLGLFPACVVKSFENWKPPPKSVSFRKCDFFRGLGFPWSFWSTSPQKPCVSASKWCINIFSTSFQYGLGISRLPKVQLVFSMEILGGVKRQTSRAAYNGPKQQCYSTSIYIFCDVAKYFIFCLTRDLIFWY